MFGIDGEYRQLAMCRCLFQWELKFKDAIDLSGFSMKLNDSEHMSR